MKKQREITEITKAIDGEFTDIQLVEKINELWKDKKRVTGALKATTEKLVSRLVERGVTETNVGDQLVLISTKCLTEYNQETLASLRNCVTEEQVWLTFKQLPSGKQLKAISDLGGASAKAVVASAKRKIETNTTVLRIKKQKAKRQGRR